MVVGHEHSHLLNLELLKQAKYIMRAEYFNGRKQVAQHKTCIAERCHVNIHNVI